MSTLDNLRKEAKRWLKALHEGDASARERFERGYPDGPVDPGLRDVQHALAREHGFESWVAFKNTLAQRQELEARVAPPAGAPMPSASRRF